jgi:uncharacterized protein YbaP (TraB family)
MKKLLRSVALAAVPALLASAAQAQSQPASAALPDADPAIWVVKDPDTTIYLFGTFHVLDGKSDWFNDEVKTAFDKSDEVVLEILAPENPAEVQALMAKYAEDSSGKPLSSRLPEALRTKLHARLTAMGAPATAFDKLKPAFAALTLVMLESHKLGLTGEHGTEAVLTKAAKSSGKKLGNLETMDFQLGMFAQMPEKLQIEMLESTLASMSELPAMFGSMKKHWVAGDAEGFAKLMQEMNAQSPAAYKTIFSDRNARWAEWIDQRLDRPGTVFLAVGTGHLAGKDSVPELLGKRRIVSKRLP